MAHIFISYAHEDEARIHPLVRALENQGWSVFWDRRIPAGQTWRSYIGKALGGARCIITAWSRHSVDSNWVGEEAEEGKQRGVLVPVLLDAVEPPIGFRSIQAADLVHWDGTETSPAFQKLVTDVAAIIGPEPEAPLDKKEPIHSVATDPSKYSRQAKRDSRSFRTTWPGRVAVAAVIFAGVGGVLGVLYGLGIFDKSKATPSQKVVSRVPPTADTQADPNRSKPATFAIPGMKDNFFEKNGHLVATKTGGPLCPTPPGWHTGCSALEPQYRQNWRNTPDGYIANGKKVKTFTNRSERVFEIRGTKQRFYVDDGYLYDYATATILCPWPKAGVGKCHEIEAQHQAQWRNTPNGFIANGKEFDRDEVMRQVRQGLF